MSIWAQILIWMGVLYFGVMIGVVIHRWLRSHGDFDGVIVVEKEGDKIVCSLVLYENPENIIQMDEVTFKVQPLVEKENRT